MRSITATIAILAALVSTSPASAQSLTLGDKAPELKVSEFVKGDAIHKFEDGQIYIIDFWATWCGPCIRMMPHMTEIQKKYKDKNVHVIGVSIWERDRSRVKPFVAKKGDGMGYTVAMDTLDNDCAQHWMAAAGRNAIPSVFIVDKGKIVWMGHPAAMGVVLAQIVDGKYSIEGAKLQEEFASLLRGGKIDRAMDIAKKGVDGAWKDNQAALNEIAWVIVDPKGPIKERDLKLAMRAAKRANELTKGADAAILDTLARCHAWEGRFEKAIALQKKAVAKAPEQLKKQLQDALEEYLKKSEVDL